MGITQYVQDYDEALPTQYYSTLMTLVLPAAGAAPPYTRRRWRPARAFRLRRMAPSRTRATRAASPPSAITGSGGRSESMPANARREVYCTRSSMSWADRASATRCGSIRHSKRVRPAAVVLTIVTVHPCPSTSGHGQRLSVCRHGFSHVSRVRVP